VSARGVHWVSTPKPLYFPHISIRVDDSQMADFDFDAIRLTALAGAAG
jgi:hypothetical protein